MCLIMFVILVCVRLLSMVWFSVVICKGLVLSVWLLIMLCVFGWWMLSSGR